VGLLASEEVSSNFMPRDFANPNFKLEMGKVGHLVTIKSTTKDPETNKIIIIKK